MVAIRKTDDCVKYVRGDVSSFLLTTGLSQADLAKATGYSQAYISSLVHYSAKPSLKFCLIWRSVKEELLKEFSENGKVEVH